MDNAVALTHLLVVSDLLAHTTHMAVSAAPEVIIQCHPTNQDQIILTIQTDLDDH